jgi:hypothetical protein
MKPLPPTNELFSLREFAKRHPTLMSESRVRWAVRNRRRNGLGDAVYETRGGQHVIHEPAFLAWFLNLTGRSKPRALRK